MDYINTAEVSRFLLLWLGALFTILAVFMCTQALFPEFTRRCQVGMNRPGKMSLWGVCIWVGLAIVGAIFSKLGAIGPVVGLILISLAIILALMGTAGLARRIGSGLQSPLDKDQPWRRTLRGGVVVVGLLLVPLLNVPGLMLVLFLGLGTAFTVLKEILHENKVAAKETDTEVMD